LRRELILVADRGIDKEFKTFTIFNKAYLDKYEKLGVRRVRPGYKFPDKDYFRWANEWYLTLPPAYKGKVTPLSKKLFGGELLYKTSTFRSSDTVAAIAGSLDYEYGTIIQKKAA
jgi:hypothetical protein